ncbi:hypothetical protein [Kamptonema sp. UHCC 0994]|uniref:hypothetical protein n=1 Tax=Kamptonema sp. UHCC 0994 TaxID=3031329 RepID=UPI0023B90CC2|nr:hypothetical protein [Kamptonema sp. UHCC 0994]MDF0554923.1 hypothetical protein [Kamptonema sp. UHCC 0994]
MEPELELKLKELAELSGVPFEELEGIKPEYLKSVLTVDPKELAEQWDDFKLGDGIAPTFKEELEDIAMLWEAIRP